MNFLEKVARNIKRFNETDKRIIDYITVNFETFDNKKVSDIAEDLFLSPNAIIRVAKKMGYTGFSEMKYAILHDNRSNQTFSVISRESNLEMKESVLKSVKTTLEINSDDNIQGTVDMIMDHKNIIFFSLGITKNYVKAFIQQLQVFNKVCILSSDRDNAISLAKNIDNDFLAVFVSVSGDTDALVKSASYLKQKKTPIIALTGLNQNSLQEFADISLYAHTDLYEVDSIDISSRAYINLLLDLIMQRIISTHNKDVTALLNE